MGLKKILERQIKFYNGEMMPYEEVKKKCEDLGFRVSNGERRLRPSEAKNIKTIYHKKGYVLGYCWAEDNTQGHFDFHQPLTK